MEEENDKKRLQMMWDFDNTEEPLITGTESSYLIPSSKSSLPTEIQQKSHSL